jgi:hypothetical protein
MPRFSPIANDSRKGGAAREKLRYANYIAVVPIDIFAPQFKYTLLTHYVFDCGELGSEAPNCAWRA